MPDHATYAHDLVISAVNYDSLLLRDIVERIAIRLEKPPVWVSATSLTDAPALLGDDDSRVVLILAQRLWGHDSATSSDAAILRARTRRRPKSVIVASLDEDPRPDWMADLPHCDLATAGIDGVVQFVLEAIAARGGAVSDEMAAVPADMPAPLTRWPYTPTPFLGQTRAHGALRRELDALATELKPRVAAVEGLGDGHILELHKLPNRVVARLDDVGVSFSWVPGSSGRISDGRLLVIEWRGVTTGRGMTALRSARPTRERVYSAEAEDNDNWCWRADSPNGRASSTANLVGEWIDGAMMGTQTVAAGD